jgi:hypothetical protein
LLPGTPNYTPAANVTKALIHVIAGGGGGGGAFASTPTPAKAGAGGGGSGSYAYRLCDVAPGVPIPCAIGTGGSGGGAFGTGGNPGFDTTIGPFPIGGFTIATRAGQGSSGSQSALVNEVYPGADGGAVATGGTYNGGGSPGDPALRLPSATLGTIGGNGGSNPYGAGGNAGYPVIAPITTPGSIGSGFGAGGGGATAIATAVSSGTTGGAGASGAIIIYEYTTSTAAETNSSVLRPALPTTMQSSRALPATALYEGGIFLSTQRVLLTSIRMRATGGAALAQVRIAFYQRSDGTIGGALPLLFFADSPLLIGGAEDFTIPVPSVMLEAGQYVALVGRFIAGLSTTIRTWNVPGFDGFNAQVVAGRAPYVFETLVSSAAAPPPTFDPLAGIVSTFNVCPLMRGGS